MGWFGPRGLASVVFTLIAFETLEHEGLVSEPLLEIATWTVFLSVIAHGLTAGPLARWYGRRVADGVVEHLDDGVDPARSMPRAVSIHSSDR